MITVIDSGILMNTSILPSLTGNVIISQKGYDEIVSSQAKQVLALLEAENRLIVMNVEEKWIKIAQKSANEIGQNRLSVQDLEVLALAIRMKENDQIQILTDDFGIRNVAHFLEIKSESINVKGGNQKRAYGYRCEACGTVSLKTISECDICGHTRFKRFRKK